MLLHPLRVSGHTVFGGFFLYVREPLRPALFTPTPSHRHHRHRPQDTYKTRLCRAWRRDGSCRFQSAQAAGTRAGRFSNSCLKEGTDDPTRSSTFEIEVRKHRITHPQSKSFCVSQFLCVMQRYPPKKQVCFPHFLGPTPSINISSPIADITLPQYSYSMNFNHPFFCCCDI